ncbi:HhH-GPD domain [Dillenia turbinata]|uniref:HhH-GPD domain n=1 Tax=Dillenia turbinata TaxID=194707 RepID=A0AAN8US61_9MAGN
MNKSRKRKQSEPNSKPNKFPIKAIEDPFPTHCRPTPQECLSIRDQLLSLHGFPQEFAKYKDRRQQQNHNGSDGLSPEESVLDGLVSTILSQNTTDVNSQRAFASLKSVFPTWDDVLAAEPKCVEDAIRCGGLAKTKAACIKNILSSLLKKRGKLCLEYLRDLSIDEIKAELSYFKGIGPKTVACVLMFHLQLDDFPVDTHIFQIAKAIGWIPAASDLKKAYLHLNQRIPNELKFDLNCLLFTHGKLCKKCSKKGCHQLIEESQDNSCPLLKYRTNDCNESLVNSGP